MPGVDPGMSTPRPPLIKSLDWLWLQVQEAVCLGHGDELSLKSLTFGPSYMKIDKSWIRPCCTM